MADDKDNKLLNEIKNYLEITWDDSLGDEKIRGMVKRGMAAISGKIGECNFYEETQERAQLKRHLRRWLISRAVSKGLKQNYLKP